MNYFDKQVNLIVKHAECELNVKYVSCFSMTVYNSHFEEEYAKTGEVDNHTTVELIEAIERGLGIEIERKTFRFIPRYFEDQHDTGIICVTWRLKGK